MCYPSTIPVLSQYYPSSALKAGSKYSIYPITIPVLLNLFQKGVNHVLSQYYPSSALKAGSIWVIPQYLYMVKIFDIFFLANSHPMVVTT